MVSIELIARRDAPALKDARLRALQDAPSAFGSTYAKESQLTDDDWQERADRWSGRRCATFLALDSEMPLWWDRGLLSRQRGRVAGAPGIHVSVVLTPPHRRWTRARQCRSGLGSNEAGSALVPDGDKQQ